MTGELVFKERLEGVNQAVSPVASADGRLYLASSSAHPGPGVHGGPGANAARAALARDRALTGDLYAAAVTAAHRSLYGPTVRSRPGSGRGGSAPD